MRRNSELNIPVSGTKRQAQNSGPAPIRLLITSDLHQRIPKWLDLVAVVQSEKPRFVIIAGDLLPKHGNHFGQRAFFKALKGHLQAMKNAGEVTPLLYFGNDDHHILEPLLDQFEATGLCVNLNGKVHREAGLVFCGMNKVRDYPFGYKHWCVPDDDYLSCPLQFCGEGLTLDAQGNYIPLKNLAAHLKGKPSIRQEITRLKDQLKPGEMARSIWVVHQPPSSLGMDILWNGEQVGSPAVLQFLRENGPLLGCSGHIHESPHMPGGNWIYCHENTVWLQPGQINHRLHYVLVELAGDKVRRCWHSVFGQAKALGVRNL